MTQATLHQIDTQLARLSTGRHDPQCQQWIDDLLDKRNQLTAVVEP